MRLFISPELNNFYGPLDEKIRRRLSQVHQNPRKYWNRDNGLILRMDGDHLTLWQAILKVDSSFPKSGQVTNKEGEVVEDWTRYPTPKLIEDALLYAAPVVGRPFGKLT